MNPMLLGLPHEQPWAGLKNWTLGVDFLIPPYYVLQGRILGDVYITWQALEFILRSEPMAHQWLMNEEIRTNIKIQIVNAIPDRF